MIKEKDEISIIGINFKIFLLESEEADRYEYYYSILLGKEK
jgi:hypothetical protein